MKKILLLLTLSGLLITGISCKKKKDDGSEPESAPSSFTKKAVIEEFTGEWCGYCPAGATIIRNIKADHPNTVTAISYHIGDSFEVPAGRYYDNLFNQYGYPGGLINRKTNAESRSYWESHTEQALNESAECGLAIKTDLSGNSLDIKVEYGGKQSFDAYLTVVIIENDVPESSPGAQAGANSGYKNPDMFREVLTSQEGESITVKKTVSSKSFNNIDLSNYNIDNVYVVAFIHKDITDTSDRSIYNVQFVKAGDDMDFD